MTAIAALTRARQLAAGPQAVVLAVLAFQGFIVATNGVTAPWIVQSFGLTQPGLARAFAWISLSGNLITVASNTAINELFPDALRATIFGWLFVAGSIGRMGAQALVATAAPDTRPRNLK